MNNQSDLKSSNTAHEEAAQSVNASTRASSHWKKKYTQPRKFLGAVVALSVLMIGLGVVLAGTELSKQSSENRSQAAGDNIRSLYFSYPASPGMLRLNPETGAAALDVKLAVAQPMSAVTFGLEFDANAVSSVVFSTTNSAQSLLQEVRPSSAGKKVVYAMLYSPPGTSAYISGENVLRMRVIATPDFAANPSATTTLTMVANNADNLPNQAVKVGSTSEILVLSNQGGLKIAANPPAGPEPTADPTYLFPGVINAGRLWYCPASACTDATVPGTPKWVSVAILPGQTTVEVPETAQKLRYDVNTVQPNEGWQVVTKAQYADHPLTPEKSNNTVRVETDVLGASAWPMTVGAVFKHVDPANSSYWYACNMTPSTSTTDPNSKEYLYYQSGTPDNPISTATCRNDTRIVVTKAGSAPAPTLTPTPTATAPLSCTAPTRFSVVKLACSTVDGQPAVRVRWTWRNQPGVTKYQLMFDDAANFSSPYSTTVNASSGTDTTYEMTLTNPSLTRYHRVRSSVASSCTVPSAWSSVVPTTFSCP